jgi:hypothetical protein
LAKLAYIIIIETRRRDMTKNEQIAYQAGLIAASYPIEGPPYKDQKLQAAYRKGKEDRAKMEPR